MKSKNFKIAGLLILIVAGVGAWSPPNGEDLIVGTPNTTSSGSGYLGVIGTGNDVTGKSLLVTGDSNTVTQNLGFVAGSNNLVTGTYVSTPLHKSRQRIRRPDSTDSRAWPHTFGKYPARPTTRPCRSSSSPKWQESWKITRLSATTATANHGSKPHPE